MTITTGLEEAVTHNCRLTAISPKGKYLVGVYGIPDYNGDHVEVTPIPYCSPLHTQTTFFTQGNVHNLAFSPDDNRIVILGAHGLKIWDPWKPHVFNREHRFEMKIELAKGASAVLSSDNTLLALRLNSGHIRIFRADKLENMLVPVAELPPPESNVCAFGFTNDSTQFYCHSEGGPVVFYRLPQRFPTNQKMTAATP